MNRDLVRAWWRSPHYRPRLSALAGVLVGGLATVAAFAPTVAGLRADLADEQSLHDAAEEYASGLAPRLRTERLRTESMREERNKYQRLYTTLKRGVERERAQLAERAAGLTEREALITAAEDVQARRTFHAGQYEVGVDIDPGKYRTNGIDDEACYWAKLRPNGSIIDNHIGYGPAVVTLPAGIIFESQSCGEWRWAG